MDAGRGRLTQLFSGAYSYWHCDALLLIPHHGHVLLLPTAGGISPQKGSPTHPARLLLSLGRNVDELLRVFDGLQTADANGVATPANLEEEAGGCGRLSVEINKCEVCGTVLTVPFFCEKSYSQRNATTGSTRVARRAGT